MREFRHNLLFLPPRSLSKKPLHENANIIKIDRVSPQTDQGRKAAIWDKIVNQTADEIIQTTCGMCFSCCGILVHIKKGRAVKIVGDPQSPVNKGSICLKARSALGMLYHPQRLIFPLKRTGARGQ